MNTLEESNSFKKIKAFFKLNKNSLSYSYNFFNKKFVKFNKLFLNENFFYNSNFYNIKRQHNFLNNLSIINNN
ncbi:hypothetical protein, partial [Staphylococcus sp. GDK8D30P]|uniref:hypothetical protein n=1 Tax=Staphylococcus sp. GDK8D30P TaxID=2804090 RepID=UPI001AEC1E2F